MKTSITSNWRPLLRAFYPFLIAFAVLWAVPRNAQAQLYISQMPLYPDSVTGIVSEYDPNTGALIKDNFIVGLQQPVALAVSGDNDLFVSTAASNSVSKFDAISGAEINRGFILVSSPGGLAVDFDLLYVVSHAGVPGKGVVSRYHITTGKKYLDLLTGLDGALELAVNPFFKDLFVSLAVSGSVACYNFTGVRKYVISGLTAPEGLAADKGNLYVANGDGVSEFDARTGTEIKKDFITGLEFPRALALWHGTLFVLYRIRANLDYRVGKYDARTGTVIKKDFITGLRYAQAIAVK